MVNDGSYDSTNGTVPVTRPFHLESGMRGPDDVTMQLRAPTGEGHADSTCERTTRIPLYNTAI